MKSECVNACIEGRRFLKEMGFETPPKGEMDFLGFELTGGEDGKIPMPPVLSILF